MNFWGFRRFWSLRPNAGLAAASLGLAAILGLSGVLKSPEPAFGFSRSAVVSIPPAFSRDPLVWPRRCIKRLVDLGRGMSEEVLVDEIVQQCFTHTATSGSRRQPGVAPVCGEALDWRPSLEPVPVTGCLRD